MKSEPPHRTEVCPDGLDIVIAHIRYGTGTNFLGHTLVKKAPNAPGNGTGGGN